MGGIDGIAGFGPAKDASALWRGRPPGGFGLAPTTMIATLCGAVPAGRLRPGDAILTRDSGYRTLLWSGHGQRGASGIGRGLVAIEPGRLGPGQPERPLHLAAGHGLLVDAAPLLAVLGTAEALAPAGSFGVAPACRSAGGFIHLLLDGHDLVNADGAWVESLAPEAAFRVFPLRAIALADRFLIAGRMPLRPRIEPAVTGLGRDAAAHRAA